MHGFGFYQGGGEGPGALPPWSGEGPGSLPLPLCLAPVLGDDSDLSLDSGRGCFIGWVLLASAAGLFGDSFGDSFGGPFFLDGCGLLVLLVDTGCFCFIGLALQASADHLGCGSS